jgi:four helix bundle protein
MVDHTAAKTEEPEIVARTYAFAKRCRRLCRFLKNEVRKEMQLAGQLERAASAVGAMVEEAQGAESKRDFVHKLSIAQKEARESHFWLRQLADADVVPQARLADLVDEGRQIKLVLAAIINATKRSMTREDE